MHSTYQLLIHIAHSVTVSVGALGKCNFPAGYYVYTGSAKRNIEARIARHQKKEKALRWHIDYLTSLADAKVVETKTFNTAECRLNQKTKGEIIVNRFGASDCKNHCGSHLKYMGKKRASLR